MKFFSLFLGFPFAFLFAFEGIEYRNFTSGFSTVHVMEVDPLYYEIRPVKALDNGIGRESVFSLHQRHGAIGSINGGFFQIGGMLDGKASGALKIQDWYSMPSKVRGCIGWGRKDPYSKMDRLQVELNVKIGPYFLSSIGFNSFRKEEEAILFAPSFHKSTLTTPDGEEAIIIDDKIESIKKGGSSLIPNKGFVLSLQEKHPLFHQIKEGMEFSFSLKINPCLDPDVEWDCMDYIVGGTPLLIHKGVKIMDFDSEKTRPTFLSNRHARTAIGILPEGHWIFVLVDKIGILDGMNMLELSDLMESFGCIYALNLDGGGSSTLVYEGDLKNSPRGDEDEGLEGKIRRVSDAIMVIPKK